MSQNVFCLTSSQSLVMGLPELSYLVCGLEPAASMLPEGLFEMQITRPLCTPAEFKLEFLPDTQVITH